MAKIDGQPLPALAAGDSRTVGPGEAITGVFYALYSRSSWSLLAQGLALAQRGDGSILLLLPAALILALLQGYPLVRLVMISMQDYGLRAMFTGAAPPASACRGRGGTSAREGRGAGS